MSIEHAPSLSVQRAGWSVNEWCYEASIGRTRFYHEIKIGRIKAKKCGSRTIVTTTPAEWHDGLPDVEVV